MAMRFVKAHTGTLRGVFSKRAWLWCCFAATTVSMAAQTKNEPPSTNLPVTAAKAGLHVFHDRVVTFVDAQLDVLKENGLYNGEEIAIVFLGITNRWEDAWQLTWNNFQRNQPVVVVPTYNLGWKWVDFFSTAADKLRVDPPSLLTPPVQIKTRKIGVPELLEHLGARGIHVFGLAFSSGANFVLQENAVRLAQYARESPTESNRPNVPSRILYHSGQISEEMHKKPLQESGIPVIQSGERALVTALQESFADMDLTGLRIPQSGLGFYLLNAAFYVPDWDGPEGRHGYAKWRPEVNAELLRASVLNAARYNLLITELIDPDSLINPESLDMPETISMILGDMKAEYVRRAQIVLALEQAKSKLEQRAKSDSLITSRLVNWDAPHLAWQIADTTRAEQVRFSTPPGERRLIGFRLPWDEDLFCRVLEATSDDLRVVYESDAWSQKQLEYTRWHTVAHKGTDEAFVLYDATGQRDHEAIEIVNSTLDQIQIEKYGDKRRVVLVGNPLNREYQRLKAAIQADEDLEVAAEVNTRNKSKTEIHKETDEALRRTGSVAGVRVRGEETEEDDRFDFDTDEGEEEEDEKVEKDTEKIKGGWRIIIKVNGEAVWEVILDEDGNIIWQGPPGEFPGGYDNDGEPIIPKREDGALATEAGVPAPLPRPGFHHEGSVPIPKPSSHPEGHAPVLLLSPGVAELGRSATLGMNILESADDFSFPPLCAPPGLSKSLHHSLHTGLFRDVGGRRVDYGLQLDPSAHDRAAIDRFSTEGHPFFFVNHSPAEASGEKIQADEAMVVLSAPQRATVTVDGSDKREQREFRYHPFPADKAYDYHYCVHLTDGRTVERTISLTAGKFVRLAVLPPCDVLDSWQLVECLPADAPLSPEVARLIITGACDKAIRLAPGAAKVWFSLAQKRHSLGAFDRAISSFTTTIEIDPGYASAYAWRGTTWKDKGEFEKAIVDFDNAIELDPKNAFAFTNRGLTWHDRSEYDRAIADFDKAIEIAPEQSFARKMRRRSLVKKSEHDKAIDPDREMAISYSKSGDVWRSRGKYYMAIRDYDKAIELDSNCVHAFVGRGTTWQLKGEHDKAIADYDEAIELDPKFTAAYDSRCVWKLKRERDKGTADLEDAIKLDPSYARAYVACGDTWRAKGEYGKATVDYDKAIKLDSDCVEAFFGRGLTRLLKRDFDKAIVDYARAIEIDPENARAYHNRGVAWHAKGEYENAIGDHTRAIEFEPTLARAFYCRGKAWAHKSDDNAIADYNKAIELNSKFTNAYLNRGHSRDRQGEYDKAIADYDKVIELDPKFTLAYIKRAKSWRRRGKYDKAIADHDKAIEIDPKSAPAYHNRANTLRLNVEFDAAIADCTKAIELDQRSAYAYVSRAQAQEMKDEYDKAIADCTRAIEIDPACGLAFRTRGRSWAEKGDFSKAIADCNRGIELDPRGGHYSRGVVWKTKGDYDKAIADLTKAIDSDPLWPCSYHVLAQAWIGKQSFDNAIAATEQLWSIAPNTVRAFLIRGDILYRVGLADEAMAAFDQALQLDSNSVHAFTGRASVWTVKGELDKAVRDFRRAVDLRPRYVETRNNLALAYHKRANAWANAGELDQATADYDKAIELCPTLARAYCNRATVKFARTDYDAALVDYSEALRLSPQLAEARAGRGAVYLAKKERNSAIAEYQQALELNQTCIAALLGLGLAKQARGNLDMALDQWDFAIRQAPTNTSAYYFRGDTWLLEGESDKALADYKRALRATVPR